MGACLGRTAHRLSPLYFISDLVLALGLSGKLPPVLAAWTPAGIFTLLGVAGLFHLEDG